MAKLTRRHFVVGSAMLFSAPLATSVDSLIEDNMCKVCLDKPIAGVLVPCGHLVLCLECAGRLKVGSMCPFCRVPCTAFSLTFTA